MYRSTLLGLLPALVLACAPAADPAAEAARAQAAADSAAAAARTAILAINSQWAAATIAGDTAFHRAIFVDDAMMFEPNRPRVSGVDAIVARMAENYAARTDTMLVVEYETLNLSVYGDQAYEFGSWKTQSRPRARPNAPVVVDSGLYVAGWRRMADGSWKAGFDFGASEVPLRRP